MSRPRKPPEKFVCACLRCLERSDCYHRKQHSMADCKRFPIDHGRDAGDCAGLCISVHRLKNHLQKLALQKVKEAAYEAKVILEESV